MSLPANNITIMDVRNAIGCPSLDLGTLCAKAATGGVSGFSFSIIENGGNATGGNLIDNAKPYWNIWSKESPGQWTVSAQKLYLRLKRDSGGSKYCYSLGSFRNYNHTAITPYIFQENSEVYLQQSITPVAVGITINWEFGEVDWAKALNSNFDSIQVYAAKTLSGTPVINQKISIAEYNKLGHFTINKMSTDFTGFSTGDPLYFWGDFYNGSAKLANFPVTNKGIIKWAQFWQKNKLGTVQVVYSANNYEVATNYTVISPSLDDATTKVTFSVYKTANDSYSVTPSRCFVRYKWRDQSLWNNSPKYSIDIPALSFTRSCWADLQARSDKSEYVDIQLVLL